MNKVEALEHELGLPEIETIVPTPNTESVYGISEIVRGYCGLDYLPRLIPGFWCHGWQPDYYHIHPELICRKSEPDRRQWFLRQAQADYLNSVGGYTRTRAIGHPIIYLPEPPVARRKNSLLVMPCRTFPGFPRDRDCAYAEAILGLRGQFDEIVICISTQSYDQGDWIEQFVDAGLPIVRGAAAVDRNGFFRLARLMSQFEYITTNGMGSQIAYGAYFGAKMSVWGPEPLTPPPTRPSRLFHRNPHLRDEFFKIMSISTLLEHEPWLGVAPGEAPLSRAWAERELGVVHKLTPEQLREEFLLTPQHLVGFSREMEVTLAEKEKYRAENDRLVRRIKELETKLEEEQVAHLKYEKGAEKKLKAIEKELISLRPGARSLAWKLLGKPAYSIEKRLRKTP